MINIYRIQVFDLIMCEYFCSRFNDFILKGESFLDYANWFSPDDYEKNDKIILKHFQKLKRWKSNIVLFVASIENLKNLRHHIS